MTGKLHNLSILENQRCTRINKTEGREANLWEERDIRAAWENDAGAPGGGVWNQQLVRERLARSVDWREECSIGGGKSVVSTRS